MSRLPINYNYNRFVPHAEFFGPPRRQLDPLGLGCNRALEQVYAAAVRHLAPSGRAEADRPRRPHD
jgi:hypothetical protein